MPQPAPCRDHVERGTDGPQQNVHVPADSPTLPESYPLQQEASSTFYNSAPTRALSREQLNEVTQAIVAVLSQRMESSNPLMVQEAPTDSDYSGIATTSAKPYHLQLRSDENESNSKESGEQGEVDINKCLQPSVPGGSPPPGCPSQPPPKQRRKTEQGQSQKDKSSPPPGCPPTPPPGEEGKYPPPPPPGCPQPPPQQDRRQNGNGQSQKDKPSPPPQQQQQIRQREINGFLNALERILIDDE